MKVTVVGTASPAATLRSGSVGTCILVEDGATRVLLDCGPGATTQLDRLGVDIRTISTIVLTHHHWDHVADLPHFVLGRWEASQFGAAGGKAFAPGLTIMGPSGTNTLVDRLFGAEGAFANCIATRFAPDIGIPLYGTRDIHPPFPPVVSAVREVRDGEEWDVGPIKFAAAKAAHCEPYLESLAYRMEAGGGTFVFSGDTAPCEPVATLAAGADLLLHDCNVSADVRNRLGQVSTHTTSSELGEIAKEAMVGHVVAIHHGLRPTDLEGRTRLKSEISSAYNGQVTIASEGDEFVLR